MLLGLDHNGLNFVDHLAKKFSFNLSHELWKSFLQLVPSPFPNKISFYDTEGLVYIERSPSISALEPANDANLPLSYDHLFFLIDLKADSISAMHHKYNFVDFFLLQKQLLSLFDVPRGKPLQIVENELTVHLIVICVEFILGI